MTTAEWIESRLPDYETPLHVKFRAAVANNDHAALCEIYNNMRQWDMTEENQARKDRILAAARADGRLS